MRKHWIFLFVVTLATSLWGQSQDIRVTISPSSYQILPAEPLRIELVFENQNPAPVLLSTEHDRSGFMRVFKIRKPDGSVTNVSWESDGFPAAPLAGKEKLVRQTDLYGAELGVFVQPGQYELWAEYVSSGREYAQVQLPGEPRRFKDVWKGTLRSNICTIKVQEPIGIDREAYERWLMPYATGQKQHRGYVARKVSIQNGNEYIEEFGLLGKILEEFPTSRYAAWTYLRRIESWGSDWAKPTIPPSTTFAALQKTDYPPGRIERGPDGKPIPDGKGGYKWQSGKEWMQSLVIQGEPIVKAHGDHPYHG